MNADDGVREPVVVSASFFAELIDEDHDGIKEYIQYVELDPDVVEQGVWKITNYSNGVWRVTTGKGIRYAEVTCADPSSPELEGEVNVNYYRYYMKMSNLGTTSPRNTLGYFLRDEILKIHDAYVANVVPGSIYPFTTYSKGGKTFPYFEETGPGTYQLATPRYDNGVYFVGAKVTNIKDDTSHQIDGVPLKEFVHTKFALLKIYDPTENNQ